MKEIIHLVVLCPIEYSVFSCCAIYTVFIFFNKKAKDSARHWSSIPGVFMGIGIFFTFLTIYDTFNYLPYMKDSNGTEIIINGLKSIDTNGLIKMIGSGFLGSIVGLFCSIVITPIIKSQINRIDTKEQEDAGENNNPYKLLQQINENTLATYLAQVQLFNENNTELKKLNLSIDNSQNIAIQQSLEAIKEIHEKLSEKLEIIFGKTDGSIQIGLSTLNNSINSLKVSLVEKINTINQETTENAALAKNTVISNLEEVKIQVASMGNSISEQAKEVINAKLESINTTFDTIDKKQQNAVDVQEKIVEDMNTILSKTQSAFNDKINEINIATTTVQNEILKMGDSISQKADEVIEAKIANLNTTFNTIDEKQKKAVESQVKIAENMKSILSEMLISFEDKINEVNKATTIIQDEILKMGDNISQKAEEVIEAKIKILEKTFDKIEKYQSRSETILKEVTHKFGKAVTQVENINDKRKEEFEKLKEQSKTLEETIETTNQVYENWKTTIDSIKDMQNNLASINNVIINIDELNSKFHEYFPSTKL